MYIYIYMFVYVCEYMYVCVYIYIYIYTHPVPAALDEARRESSRYLGCGRVLLYISVML